MRFRLHTGQLQGEMFPQTLVRTYTEKLTLLDHLFENSTLAGANPQGSRVGPLQRLCAPSQNLTNPENDSGWWNLFLRNIVRTLVVEMLNTAYLGRPGP